MVVGSPVASNSEGRVGAASVYTLDDAQLLGSEVTGASVGDDFGVSVTISRDGAGAMRCGRGLSGRG